MRDAADIPVIYVFARALTGTNAARKPQQHAPPAMFSLSLDERMCVCV